MREALALLRASWLTQASYRVSLVLSLMALPFTVLPLYFVARALQPLAANAIASQGGEYFAFALVGIVVFSFIMTAVNTIPLAISSGIATGTLEALLSTRASLPSLVGGLISYSFLWTTIRAILLLGFGLAFGVHLTWSGWFNALVILTLIVLAYIPFGVLFAAMHLAFRTTGPLPQAVLLLSGLLGGVYYPTTVIPGWIQRLSELVPLTYGLRALRQTILTGASLNQVSSDVITLVGFVILLSAASLFAFAEALHYARRIGTLAQY